MGVIEEKVTEIIIAKGGDTNQEETTDQRMPTKSKMQMNFMAVDVQDIEGSSDEEAMDFEAMKRRVED